MFSAKGHSGAMIALIVPDPENYALNPSSGNELPADELHITLAYMGEAADLSDDEKAAILDAVQVLADTSPSPEALFPATTGVFPPADPDEDGSDTSVSVPYYAAPANPERFNALREDLLVHLAARGVASLVNQKFPVFSPHVTLTYEPLDAPPDLSSLPTPLPTRFHTIVVKFGDEMHVYELDQPADGPELPLTASIRNDLHRLSVRTETAEDYLTALYLRQRQVRSTPAQTRAQAAYNIVASAVDPHYRSQQYNRIQTLTERARTEVSPAARLLAANRALALAARTPAPASPNEARELQAITASIRTIIADGNSSIARSLRAKRQLRDRYGRWIEEGGGVRFKIKVPGAPGGGQWVHGTATGFDVPNGKVFVKLNDGRTVAIPNNKIEQPKAILNMGLGGALDKAKSFLPRSAGRKGKASLPKDHDPAKEASDKAADAKAVEAMDHIQAHLAETYPDAKVSGGNIAPLVNDPALIDAETKLGDMVAGPITFVPTKKPAGTANGSAEVTLDKADIDTIRGALDRLTVDYMPSEADLAALPDAEQKKAKQTARGKAYGRLATLYNERGADQELLRAPAVGTNEDLPEVTEESVPPKAGAPSSVEVLDAISEAEKALFEAVPDDSPLSGARDKLHTSLTDAVDRWNSGKDDIETFAQNLDLIKEFANAQEPSFKPSYAKPNPAEEAFGHFAEDLDDIHASIDGHDNVDQAKAALDSASTLIQNEVDAEDTSGDGSPMGWTPVLDDLHAEVSAVQKQLDEGFYLNEPEKLINDLNSVSESLDKQAEHLDATQLDDVKASLAEAAQNLANTPGDAPDTAPDTDESADGPATPVEAAPQAQETDFSGALDAQIKSLHDKATGSAHMGEEGTAAAFETSAKALEKLKTDTEGVTDPEELHVALDQLAGKTDQADTGPLPDSPTTETTPQAKTKTVLAGQIKKLRDSLPPRQTKADPASMTNEELGQELAQAVLKGNGVTFDPNNADHKKLADEWSKSARPLLVDSVTKNRALSDEELKSKYGSQSIAAKYKTETPEAAPEAATPASEAPATPEAPAPEAPAASEADAAPPGDPADYTDAPDGSTDAEKASWDAYSDVAGAISDMLQSHEDIADDTGTLEPAKFKFQGLLNDWYEDTPDGADAIESFASEFENAAGDLEQAYLDNGVPSDQVTPFADANTSFVKSLNDLQESKLAADGDNPDNADNQNAPEAAPTPDQNLAPVPYGTNPPTLDTFNNLAEDLIDLKDYLEDGDELKARLSEAANEIANIGKYLEDGTFEPSDAVDHMGNTIKDLESYLSDQDYEELLTSTDLGDNLNGAIDDLTTVRQQVSDDEFQFAGGGSSGDSNPPTANDDSEDNMDDSDFYGGLPPQQKEAFDNAHTELTNWLNSTEDNLFAEPDFEDGQGAGVTDPVQAQEDFAQFRNAVEEAVNAYVDGDDTDGQLEAHIHDAQETWLKSEGFKELVKNDQDGGFSEEMSGGEQIDNLLETVGTGQSTAAADDLWGDTHLSAQEALGELPDPATVSETIPDAEQEYQGLTDALHALADATPEDSPDAIADVINAKNLLDDKLEAAASDPATGPDQKDFAVGAQQHTDDVIDSLTSAAPATFEPEDQTLSAEQMGGIINQLHELGTPMSEFMANVLGNKMLDNEGWTENDKAAIKELLGFVGSSDQNTPEEKADYTTAADALDAAPVTPEVPETPETPDTSEASDLSTPFEKAFYEHNAPDALSIEDALAEWGKSLEEFNSTSGVGIVGKVSKGASHNDLSSKQKENLADIIDTLPSAVGEPLEQALTQHIGKEITDDDLLQAITNALFDVNDKKLRGRLRGASQGIQQNKGSLVPILRPKNDHYQSLGEHDDFYLASPSEVAATMKAILKQAASGADFADLKAAEGNDADVRDLIKAATAHLQEALNFMDAGDVGGMVDNMQAARDFFDQAIAKRLEVHKHDKTVRRLRARRRALDEVTAGFEGHWADEKIMGNPQAWKPGTNYSPSNGFTDRDGNMVYPGDQIERLVKGVEGQTGLVLGWRESNDGKTHGAHLWLDQEKKERPQGVTQKSILLAAVGPNNPLYHDPSYTGPKVDDDLITEFTPIHEKKQEKQAKKEAKKAAEAAAPPSTPRAATPPPVGESSWYDGYLDDISGAGSSAMLDGYIESAQDAFEQGHITQEQLDNLKYLADDKHELLNGSDQSEYDAEADQEYSDSFHQYDGMISAAPDLSSVSAIGDMIQDSFDNGELSQDELSDLETSAAVKKQTFKGKLVPGTDLSANPDIVEVLKDAKAGDQITTPSTIAGTDFDTWKKGDDGYWHSEHEIVPSAHFADEEGPITVVGGEPAKPAVPAGPPSKPNTNQIKADFDAKLDKLGVMSNDDAFLSIAVDLRKLWDDNQVSVKHFNQIMRALDKKWKAAHDGESIAGHLAKALDDAEQGHFLTGVDSQVAKATSSKDLDEILQNAQALHADGVIDDDKYIAAQNKISAKKLSLLDIEPETNPTSHAPAEHILPDGYPQPPKGSKALFETTTPMFSSFGIDYVVQHPDGSLHNYSKFPNNNWKFIDELQDPAQFENDSNYKPFEPVPTTNQLHALPASLTGKSGDGYTEGRHFGLYGGAGIALVHTDENGKKWVLIGQRGDTDTKGEEGSWYLPGGALDEKESPIQGATREFHEEVLNGESYTPNWQVADTHVYTDDHDNGWSYSTLVVNADEMPNLVPPPDAPPYEFHTFQWVDADQLDAMDKQGLLHGAMSDGKFAQIVGMQPSVSAPEDLTPAPAEVPEDYTNLPGENPDLAAVVHDMQGWKMVSGSKGSQTGGVYEAPNGDRFYIKRPKTDQHVHSEVLASAMYEALGINTTQARVGMMNGKLYVVTPWVNGDSNGLQKAVTTKNQEFLNKVRDDFAADVLMGNYDAVGPGYANIIADGNGEPLHVDAGASFFYRGTGGSKSWWGPDPVEWSDMRNGSGKSGSYGTAAQVFGPMTDEQLTASASKLLNLSPKQISDMVNSSGLPVSKKLQLIDTLIKRRHNILEKAGLLDSDGNVAKDTADKAITTAENAQAVQAVSAPEFHTGQEVTWKIGANVHTGVLSTSGQNGWVVHKDDGSVTFLNNGTFAALPEAQPDFINPLSNVALIHNGHVYKTGDEVKFLKADGTWNTGAIQGVNEDVPSFANIVDDDGWTWPIPFDKITTPEVYEDLGSPLTFGNPPTTQSPVSLGDEFAVVPEGSKILKKNVTDWGQELVLVQHPDGGLYVYKSDGTFAPGFGKGPSNYKAEKGWVDFQVTMPAKTNEQGEGFSILGAQYEAPPAGSKVLFKQASSSAPSFIVQHPDGKLYQYNHSLAADNLGQAMSVKVDSDWTPEKFAALPNWQATENMVQPGTATITPVTPEYAAAALSTPGAEGSNDGPIQKGSFVQVTKYAQGSDPIYGKVVGFNKQTGGWRIAVTDAEGNFLPDPKGKGKFYYRSFKADNLQHVGGANAQTGPTNVPGAPTNVPENASLPSILPKGYDVPPPGSKVVLQKTPEATPEGMEGTTDYVVKHPDGKLFIYGQWEDPADSEPIEVSSTYQNENGPDWLINTGNWEGYVPTTPAAVDKSNPVIQPSTQGLPTGITLSAPDTSNPLFGTPTPEPPKAAEVVAGDMVDADWMKRAGDAYTARKVGKGENAKKLEDSSYFNSYYAQVKQGSLTALDFLNSKGYFESDPKLYDEAKAKIDAHAEKLGEAIAQHQKELDEFSNLMAEWQKANGQAFYTPLDPKTVNWNKSHSAAHTAMMKRFQGVYNKLSSKASSALQTQKGSSSWQTHIRLLSKVLGLDRKDVAAHASPYQMETWDGMKEMADIAGPVGFAWKGIRTVTVNRFADASGNTLDSHADLTQIIGTIQKDHGAMEFTPGDIDAGGKIGYNSGPVRVALTVPPEIKGFYTPAGSFSHSGEHGFIAEPGLAMYIWDVKPSTSGNFAWEVSASLIPREVLPFMNNFTGGPAAHPIHIPGKTINPDGTEKSINDGTEKSKNDGTAKNTYDGTAKSDNDGSA